MDCDKHGYTTGREACALREGYDEGVRQEREAVLRYLNGAYEGPASDFVVTTRDNVKSGQDAYPFDKAVDDVCLHLADMVGRARHREPDRVDRLDGVDGRVGSPEPDAPDAPFRESGRQSGSGSEPNP